MSIDARLETDNYAETNKWGITAPFITMQLAKVTRRDFDGNLMLLLLLTRQHRIQLQMQWHPMQKN